MPRVFGRNWSGETVTKAEEAQLVESALRRVFHLRSVRVYAGPGPQPVRAMCGVMFTFGKQDHSWPTCPECTTASKVTHDQG